MADAKCWPTERFIGENNLQDESLETEVTHSTNHLVPLLRKPAFALSAEVTRQELCLLPDFTGMLRARRVSSRLRVCRTAVPLVEEQFVFFHAPLLEVYSSPIVEQES